ncbi:phage tail length tape measure protein [Halobacillus sp. BAB-2008]|uniref:phage tail protein n=1 Tax=Halobacillus sp. BAB-2008 TaxID=1246484 RepID=UPI0002A512D9|nr:phage tail length tape measure protein [Halobacillus sp. BAB-2008]ELK47178.1 phage tail length tape-measure protein [Halobacillus sp. BAB-2008]
MANYSVDAELKASVSKYRRAIQAAKRVTEKFKKESESMKDAELNADTSPLKRNLKKARRMLNLFARKRSKAEVNVGVDDSEAKRKMGLLLAVKTALNKKIVIPIEARIENFQKTMSRIANSIQAFGTIAGNTFRGLGLMISSSLVPIIASMVPAIMAVGNAIGVVGSGTVALAAAFGIAGSAAIAYGAAAAPTIQSIIDGTAEATKENVKAAKQLKSLKTAWEKVQEAIAPQVAVAFGNAMAGLETVVESLNPMFTSMADTVASLSERFQKFLKSSSAQSFFDYLNKKAAPIFEKLVNGITGFIEGMMNLTVAFAPLTDFMAQGFAEMGSSFAKFTERISGSKELESFIGYVKENLPVIRKIFGDVFKGIINLFVAFSENSSLIFGSLSKMTARFREWSATVSKSDGFQKFIQYVQDNGPKVISLIGNLVNFIINMGIALAPLGSAVLGAINSFLQWSNAMMETHPIIGKIIASMTLVVGALVALVPNIAAARAAFAGLGGVLTKVLGKAFTFLKAPIASFQTLIAQIGARVAPLAGTFLPLLRTALMALTGPVGVIIGVLTLLIPVFVRLWKENEAFRQGVQTAWALIQQVFTTVINFIANFVRTIIGELVAWWTANQQTFYAVARTAWNTVYNAIVTVLTTIWGFIQQIVSRIQSLWSAHGDAIMRVASFAWNTIVSIVTTLAGVLQTVISSALQIIKGIFQAVWPAISGIVQVAWSVISTAVEVGINLVMGILDTVMSLIKGDWESAWDTIKSTATDIMDSIVNTFEGISLVEIGKDIIQGLINGIESMFGGIKDMVKKAADLIPGWLKKKLGIHSPSKVTTQIGVWTGQGMENGVGKMIPRIAKKAKEMADAITPKKKNVGVSTSLQLKASNISSSLRNLKRRSVGQVENAVNTNVEFRDKQPANIYVQIGRNGFRAFVDDITNEQELRKELQRHFS